jgi:hypothetical protein
VARSDRPDQSQEPGCPSPTEATIPRINWVSRHVEATTSEGVCGILQGVTPLGFVPTYAAGMAFKITDAGPKNRTLEASTPRSICGGVDPGA